MKTLSKNHFEYSFDQRLEPVLEVTPGERFRVETADCYGGQLLEQGGTDCPSLELPKHRNPATGPIFVRGANPGGTLQISIHGIEVAGCGITTVFPGRGPLGDRTLAPFARISTIRNGVASLFNRFRVPVHAMVGVIGVAPAGKPVPTDTPGAHGGNLDTKEIAEGCTLHLPVFVEGALLALGDVHAIMGDGEVCGTGLEVEAVVTLSAQVSDHESLQSPVIETAQEWIILGSGRTVECAARRAADAAVRFLRQRLGLSFEESYMLLSLVSDLRISQVVNPRVTVRMKVPSGILEM